MVWGRNEADTCRDLVVPAVEAAGWAADQVIEQLQLQNPDAQHAHVAPGGRLRIADYVLTIGGVPLVVVEAKREYRAPGDGIQQCLDYALRLDAPLAVSTNGHRFVLHDRTQGIESEIETLPTPEQAWAAYSAWIGQREGTAPGLETARTLHVPFDRSLTTHGGIAVKVPRYYQRLAVHAAVRAIGRGENRVLLLMATGTGKTFTALQLVHKLRTQAVAAREGRPYRVLYLADRDILVREPMGEFRQAFDDAVHRLRSSELTLSRDVYFATYQTLDRAAPDDVPPPEEGVDASVFHALPADFFDLVVVDECHRGSASAESSWRGILEHFSSAVQVGLTATPKRDVNVDTYEYFGEPVFSYSLREGIEDGFLAPYRVRRAVLDVDALGWTPAPGQLDRFGAAVPEGTYGTPDFERRLSLPDRTAAMARHLASLLAAEPAARAAVFCVDAEHAQQMRQSLMAADPDRTRQDPAWVARIVGAEPERDRLLEEFTSPDRTSPAVATTARLLSTGVDIEDLRYVVLCRPVGSMIEFKQIIGRGTRLYPPKGKQDFWVIDYVGASAKFADPEFDGPPLAPISVEHVHPDGSSQAAPEVDDLETVLDVAEPEAEFTVTSNGALDPEHRKLYVDGQEITLLGERVMIPDPTTGSYRLVEYTTFVRDQVRTLFPGVEDLRTGWSREALRTTVREQLRARGVAMDELVRLTGRDDADPFDVVAQVAWDLPALSRRQRADGARHRHAERLDALSGTARAVVDAVLERYAERGPDEISVRGLTVPPLPVLGTPWELADEFGGPERLRSWLDDLQDWIYEPQDQL